MKDFGIPLRDNKSALRFNKGQMAFGERHVRAGVISLQKEKGVIDLMIQLRSKDMSYWKIAAELTRRGIPTKSGNKQWKAATVMKICKRVRKDPLGLMVQL